MADSITTSRPTALHDGWALPYVLHMGIRSLDTPLFRETLGTADPLAHIDHAAQLGIAGIADNMLRLRSPVIQSAMGERLRACGLRFGSFITGPDNGPKLWWGRTDAATSALIRSEIAECVAAARRVGAEILTITSMIDREISFDAQLGAMAGHLGSIMPMAVDADLKLGLEIVSRDRVPDLLLQHLGDALRVVEQVSHPSLGLVFDTHHVRAMDGNVQSALRTCEDRVVSIQLADFPERFEPGTGEIDFGSLLSGLKARCPDLLVEWEFYASRTGADGETECLKSIRRMDRRIS